MKNKTQIKKEVDFLWDRFCKRELTLDQLIDQVNNIKSKN